MSHRTTLDRRTVLKGAGVALALPWMESLASGAPDRDAKLPKRLCCIMFPYGVALPQDDSPEREWGWFPVGQGHDFEYTKVLEPLAPLREESTVISGLSHPECRSMNGHDTGDTFLTATKLAGASYRNAVSLDQYAAARMGENTRFPSLVLSTDGGVGPRTRSTTLSYTSKGQPVPALSSPKRIFDLLFVGEGAGRAHRRRIENAGSILDLVREQSRDLRPRLGTPDRRKLDEYETSVREVEQRVERSQKWLKTPLPEVDASAIALDADPDGPKEYVAAVYDLMFLAYQTDVTRVATYQIGSYGPTLARTFPAALGLPGNWHGLAHGASKKGGAEKLGRFDRFLAENLARFLTRMKEASDGEGSLLDRTVVLYGSSNSRTHQNRNYPLVLAGGGSLGLRHGRHLVCNEKTPMSNLFVSMLQAVGVETDQFADSTGPLAELS